MHCWSAAFGERLFSLIEPQQRDRWLHDAISMNSGGGTLPLSSIQSNAGGNMPPANMGTVVVVTPVSFEFDDSKERQAVFAGPPMMQKQKQPISTGKGTTLHNARLSSASHNLNQNANAVAIYFSGDFGTDFERICRTLGMLHPHPVLASRIARAGSKTAGTFSSSSTSFTDISNNSQQSPKKGLRNSTPALEFQKEIRVFGVQIDSFSALALSMALPSARALTTLYLSHTKLSAQSLFMLVSALEKSAVQRVTIDFNGTSQFGFSDSIDIESPASALLNCTSIQSLSLRGNQFDSRIATQIFRKLTLNRTLASLDLFSNNIDSEACKVLADVILLNQTLTALNLGNNCIDDNGSAALALSFQSIPLSDREVAKQMKKDGYRISTIKNRPFRDANASLRSLNLSNNRISADGLLMWLPALQDGGSHTVDLRAGSTQTNSSRKTSLLTKTSSLEVRRDDAEFVRGPPNQLQYLTLLGNEIEPELHKKLIEFPVADLGIKMSTST